MRSGASRTEATLCAIVMCALLVIPALPVSGSRGLPADTENMFGVGARADSMGDAFVAIANDATAAFWNPAGLSYLKTTQLTAVVKSLPRTAQATQIAPGIDDLGGFPGFGNVMTSNVTTNRPSISEATFVSITARLGSDPAKQGTICVSRALAGYVDREWTIDQAFNAVDPGEVASMTTFTHDRLRMDYNSIAYGWKPGTKLSAGAGIVQAEAHALTEGTLAQTFLGEDEPSASVFGPDESEGKGYGGIFGLLYTPSVTVGELTLGASYLTKIHLKGFGDSGYGTHRPDRLLLGANYKQPVPGAPGRDVQWSLQLSHTGSADINGGDAARYGIWDFYFGGEYGVHRMKMNYMFRYGLFSNKSANDDVYGDETWVTLGLGAGQTGTDWEAELAMQQGLRTGTSLLSFSGGYSF